MAPSSGKHWLNSGKREKKLQSTVLNWLSVEEAWDTLLRQQQNLYYRPLATKINTDE